MSQKQERIKDIRGLQQELGTIYEKVNKFPEEIKGRIEGLDEEEKEEIKRIFDGIERQMLGYEDELRGRNDVETIKNVTAGMESSIKELEEAVTDKETYLVLKDIKAFVEELGVKIDNIESWLRGCIKENPGRIKEKVIKLKDIYRRFDRLATRLIRDSIKQGISKNIEEISRIRPRESVETLSSQFEEVIAGISDIVNELEELSKLPKLEGGIDEIVVGKTRAILEDIKGEGDSFKEVSEDIERKVRNFKSSVVNIVIHY